MSKIKEKVTWIRGLLPSILAVVLVAYLLGDYQPEQNSQVAAANTVQTNTQTQSQEVTTQESTTQETTETTTQAVLQSQFPFADGVYNGAAKGYGGNVTVAVTIKQQQLKEVQIVSAAGEDEPFFSRAKGVIDTMKSNQSITVDTVSGATYSSKGIIMAVMNALYGVEAPAVTTTTTATKTTTEKTTSASDEVTYKDGTYTGEGEGFKGTVKVQVKMKKNKIKSIKIISHQDDVPYFKKAQKIKEDVVKAQSTKVDTVSGATYSSNGILAAIENALEKAETKSAKASKKKATSNTSSKQTSASKKKTSNTTSDSKKTTSSTKNTTAANNQQNNNSNTADAQKKSDAEKNDTNNTTQSSATTQTQADPSVATQSDAGYKDGDYEIVTICYPDDAEDFEQYQLSVKVTITNGVITAISDVKGVGADYDSTNNSFIKKAVSGSQTQAGAVKQITEKGTPEGIDAVSGATCTVNAIVRACQEALAKAKQ